MKILIKLYELFIIATSNLQSLVLLLIRLFWGWQFTAAGWTKLTHIGTPIALFTRLGIPAPVLSAWFVSGLELFGGILLFLGLGSRLIALPLTIDMIVAYLTADRESVLHFFSDPDKFIDAAPCTFLFASLVVLVFGPGKISLDGLLSRKFRKPAVVAPKPAVPAKPLTPIPTPVPKL